MYRISSGRARHGAAGFRKMLVLPLLALLTACSEGPDMSKIEAERAHAVHRYDLGQSLAANAQVVVAGLQSGAVLVSADLGSTWKRHELGRTSLVDIAVCHDGGFIAIDHYRKLWFADAGGEKWTSVAIEQPETPLSVACDPQGGWWIGGTHARLVVSRDQGQSWMAHELGGDLQITAVQFIDATHAVALGEFGFIAFSEDGGQNWRRGEALPDEFYPYAALFADRDQGWVAGIAGQILHTKDGGKHWEKQENATQASLYRLFMHRGVPHGVGGSGVIARLDGGVWRNVRYPDPLPVTLGAGASLPGQNAIVVGGPGGLLRTVGFADNT